MLLKACLNGARRPGSHPALPVTPEDVGKAAQGAVDAGAGAIHVHPRDASGREALDADSVGAAVEAVRAACPGVPVGVTTGAWIEPDPDKRLALVKGWQVLPDFASVNFSEAGAEEVAALLAERGVRIEAGLWSGADVERYLAGGWEGRCLRILIEPRGQTVEEALRTVGEIERLLDAAGSSTPRLLHGGQANAWGLLEEAARRGYDSRIGLEDTLTLPDGAQAADNAVLIAAGWRAIKAVQAG